MTKTKVWLPKRGHHVHLTPIARLRAQRAAHAKFHFPKALPPATLPIDWTKGNTLSFPILGNDQYGDCMYVAGCHADQTFTGNGGVESTFDASTVVSDYEQLSGGDNGLDEAQIVGAWKQGLGGVPEAKILDSLDIDPTDATLTQAAMHLFGGVFFTLAIPNKWLNNFETGAVWDAPAIANPANGHGIWWNGCQASGNYELQTWGTYGYITPAGVALCDPAAFVVFSLRWFNAQGYAPNGMHYTTLAPLWQQAGGNALPPSPFPAPGPAPSPAPTPGPTPSPAGVVLSPGTYIVK